MIETLPSGNKLITDPRKGTYILLVYSGPMFLIEMLGPNEEEPGSDEWLQIENKIANTIKKYS